MLELLEQLFRQVRGYMQSERYDRNQVYAQSPKHTTMQFDRDAEDIIIQGLNASGYGFEIITEEQPTSTTVENPPYRIVVDPVDGSTNVERGITTAAVALAVLPIEAPILPENVQWALVGELYSGTVFEAQKGGGAFRNGKRCQTSTITQIKDCVLGLNLDGSKRNKSDTFLQELPRSTLVRRSGSSAMDSVYVASATYDAYVDIRDDITGESFLASASIVLEAGGLVSDHEGNALQPITNLNDKYSLLLSGNKKLQQAMLQRLKE